MARTWGAVDDDTRRADADRTARSCRCFILPCVVLNVDADYRFASLNAYLLARMYFGLLYWALEQVQPGMSAASNFSRSSAIYFSLRCAGNTWVWYRARTDVARGFAIAENEFVEGASSTLRRICNQAACSARGPRSSILLGDYVRI